MSDPTVQPVTNVATWTATPQQVERLIAAVLPHAEADGYHPALTCVHLELSGDAAVAVTTDRYTIGICWASLSDWSDDAEDAEPVAVNIYARDLRRLFTFIKPHKTIPVTWTLTDESLTVAAGVESLSVRTVDVDFIKWRALLPKVLGKASAAIPAMAFDPLRVEKFTQSAKALGERLMVWRLGGAATDAPVVQIGNRFLGILMPVRLPEELPDLDLTEIGVESAPKAVAA